MRKVLMWESKGRAHKFREQLGKIAAVALDIDEYEEVKKRIALPEPDKRDEDFVYWLNEKAKEVYQKLMEAGVSPYVGFTMIMRPWKMPRLKTLE